MSFRPAILLSSRKRFIICGLAVEKFPQIYKSVWKAGGGIALILKSSAGMNQIMIWKNAGIWNRLTGKKNMALFRIMRG